MKPFIDKFSPKPVADSKLIDHGLVRLDTRAPGGYVAQKVLESLGYPGKPGAPMGTTFGFNVQKTPEQNAKVEELRKGLDSINGMVVTPEVQLDALQKMFDLIAKIKEAATNIYINPKVSAPTDGGGGVQADTPWAGVW